MRGRAIGKATVGTEKGRGNEESEGGGSRGRGTRLEQLKDREHDIVGVCRERRVASERASEQPVQGARRSLAHARTRGRVDTEWLGSAQQKPAASPFFAWWRPPAQLITMSEHPWLTRAAPPIEPPVYVWQYS